jgi:hypothetical protein
VEGRERVGEEALRAATPMVQLRVWVPARPERQPVLERVDVFHPVGGNKSI